jgi:hypothetical protein
MDEEDNIEESIVAKSTGEQEERDVVPRDAALYQVLNSKKKITKMDARYREQEIRIKRRLPQITTT